MAAGWTSARQEPVSDAVSAAGSAADDPERRADLLARVARGVARGGHEAVAPGPERAAPEPAGEAEGARVGGAGERAAHADVAHAAPRPPQPARRLHAAPAAAPSARATLDREAHGRRAGGAHVHRRPDDRGDLRDAAAPPGRPEAPGAQRQRIDPRVDRAG